MVKFKEKQANHSQDTAASVLAFVVEMGLFPELDSDEVKVGSGSPDRLGCSSAAEIIYLVFGISKDSSILHFY